MTILPCGLWTNFAISFFSVQLEIRQVSVFVPASYWRNSQGVFMKLLGNFPIFFYAQLQNYAIFFPDGWTDFDFSYSNRSANIAFFFSRPIDKFLDFFSRPIDKFRVTLPQSTDFIILFLEWLTRLAFLKSSKDHPAHKWFETSRQADKVGEKSQQAPNLSGVNTIFKFEFTLLKKAG